MKAPEQKKAIENIFYQLEEFRRIRLYYELKNKVGLFQRIHATIKAHPKQADLLHSLYPEAFEMQLLNDFQWNNLKIENHKHDIAIFYPSKLFKESEKGNKKCANMERYQG